MQIQLLSVVCRFVLKAYLWKIQQIIVWQVALLEMLITIVGIVWQLVQMILNPMQIKLIISVLMNAGLDSSVITQQTYVLSNVPHLLIIMEILILGDVFYSALRVVMLKMIQENANNNVHQTSMLTI